MAIRRLAGCSLVTSDVVDEHRSGIHRLQAGDHAQDRRLAASRTDRARRRTRPCRPRDSRLRDRGEFAVALADRAHLDMRADLLPPVRDDAGPAAFMSRPARSSSSPSRGCSRDSRAGRSVLPAFSAGGSAAVECTMPALARSTRVPHRREGDDPVEQIVPLLDLDLGLPRQPQRVAPARLDCRSPRRSRRVAHASAPRARHPYGTEGWA